MNQRIGDWVQKRLWVGGQRRVGIAVWFQPYGPWLSHQLGQYTPGLASRREGWVRIPLTRWCLATYRRTNG